MSELQTFVVKGVGVTGVQKYSVGNTVSEIKSGSYVPASGKMKKEWVKPVSRCKNFTGNDFTRENLLSILF